MKRGPLTASRDIETYDLYLVIIVATVLFVYHSFQNVTSDIFNYFINFEILQFKFKW